MDQQAAKIARGMMATLMLLALLAAAETSRAEDEGATARGLFAMLPASIFETTAEGLSEADKQQLLTQGHSEFWEISGETPDVLVFSTLPFRDRAVGLRLFHNSGDGSTEAAVGTLGERICTVELWRQDASGRIVPIETPPEPDVREFLAKGQKLPAQVTPNVLICLGLGGLKAVPIFWSSKGLVEVPLANDVSYQWTGTGFEKRVSKHESQSH